MSPEQWHDPGSGDMRSDIYSFGVMLYEMLTHVHPFYGKSRQEVYRKHLGYTPRPPSAIRPDIPVSVDRVVARCLEKEREARYPNFTALQFALMHILQREFREIVPPILSRERATADEMNERGRPCSAWADCPRL